MEDLAKTLQSGISGSYMVQMMSVRYHRCQQFSTLKHPAFSANKHWIFAHNRIKCVTTVAIHSFKIYFDFRLVAFYTVENILAGWCTFCTQFSPFLSWWGWFSRRNCCQNLYSHPFIINPTHYQKEGPGDRASVSPDFVVRTTVLIKLAWTVNHGFFARFEDLWRQPEQMSLILTGKLLWIRNPNDPESILQKRS